MSITVVSQSFDSVAKAASQALDENSEEIKDTDSKVADDTAEADESEENQESEANEDAGSSEELSASEDGESDEEKQQEQKPKKKSGWKRKISKLENSLSLKDQEIEYWKQQALKEKTQETEPEKKSVSLSEKKPVRDDFESLEDYMEALTDWKVEKARAEDAAKETEKTIKTEFDKKHSSYQERLSSTKKELADFDEVLNDFILEHGDMKFSNALRDLVLESDIGPKIVYELAKNVELLEEINGLSPLAAAKEFGKLEDRLTKPKAKAEIKTKTDAPQPIKPVGAKQAAVKKTLKDAASMTQAEYEAMRREQMKKHA